MAVTTRRNNRDLNTMILLASLIGLKSLQSFWEKKNQIFYHRPLYLKQKSKLNICI